jgi:response regulator RpfG family c-di-GMP phosphodiesterase
MWILAAIRDCHSRNPGFGSIVMLFDPVCYLYYRMTQNMEPVRRYSLVLLDEDTDTVRQINHLLGKVFRVLSTPDSKVALRWLESDRSVKVLLVDQNIRGVSGLEILDQARVLRPDIRRILITRYDDLSSIIQGLHSDAVNRTISKPVDRTELVAALTFAVDPVSAPAN